MKRLGLVLLLSVVLVLFLARGDAPAPQPDPEETVRRRVPVPIPAPPPRDPVEEARGIYMFESGDVRVALDLQAGRAFRSHASLPGREPRETSGTWSLAGSDLTLTYRRAGGEPIADGPKYERCRYLGDRVEMTVPGRSEPLVLRKRAVIRHR